MNTYCTLDQVKSDLGLTGTTPHDSRLMRYIEAVSRSIDEHCNRFFYPWSGVRYQTPDNACQCPLDCDLLSVTTLATDENMDGLYSTTQWAEAIDFALWPANVWPKQRIHTIPKTGSYGFAESERYAKVTGLWGYGDGVSATPWRTTAITGTVATTTGTTLTLSASGTVEAGHTLRIGTEFFWVSAVSGTSATVERGVNGSTAAIQSAATVSIVEYPKNLERACAWLAAYEFKQAATGGMQQERIGNYSYTRAMNDIDSTTMRLLGKFVRQTVLR